MATAAELAERIFAEWQKDGASVSTDTPPDDLTWVDDDWGNLRPAIERVIEEILKGGTNNEQAG